MKLTSHHLRLVRENDAYWKAGYRAAVAHRRELPVGKILAVASLIWIAGRRHRLPVVALVAWIGAVVMGLAPFLLLAVGWEWHHRRRVRDALRWRPPVEEWPPG